MTVAELIKKLQEFPPDAPVIGAGKHVADTYHDEVFVRAAGIGNPYVWIQTEEIE